MDVRHFADARAALGVVAEPLGAAGAEGELSLGLLRRLVDTPDAFGSEVTMIAGDQDGRPVVFVLMTGDHPAHVAGSGSAIWSRPCSMPAVVRRG